MSSHDHSAWSHDHAFDAGSAAGERGTRRVVWITLAAMVLEIAAGWYYNSMALLADGWHMSSHTLAIGLSLWAYTATRRFAGDPRFAFGTWKIEILAGYTSAWLLLVVAALMVVGSLERLLSPQPIRYPEAIVVAVVGLVVNLVCALILGHAQRADGHDHGHAHGHNHAHSHGHDLNLRSAYLHVIADAATSVLAIVALLGGWWYGWAWLDPAIGIVGAVLIALWARGLIGDTGKVLLDREMDHPVVDEIREELAKALPGARGEVTDLHVWRVGRAAYACALTVVTHDPGLTAAEIRQCLAVHEEIVHLTIELNLCEEDVAG